MWIKRVICFSIFSLCLSSAVFANDSRYIGDLLQKMQAAQKNLNYDLTFIQVKQDSIDSLRYQHATENSNQYAQLFYLDGNKQEVLLRGNLVSYFSKHYQPFSIKASKIIDSLPTIIYADFSYLKSNYDFIDVGKARIADRTAKMIQILPKDNFRYHYVVWIDEQSNILLRSDLVDKDGIILEQFRAIKLNINSQAQDIIPAIEKATFPPLLVMNESTSAVPELNWNTSWLPSGFKLLRTNLIKDENTQSVIESRFYSDGLFTFNLYVADDLGQKAVEQFWKDGANTIYTENISNKNITIIGQIPPTTAKRITQDVEFKLNKQVIN